MIRPPRLPFLASKLVAACVLFSGQRPLRALDGADRPALRLAHPVEHEVRQRTTALEGTLLVAGEISALGQATSVLEARLTGGGLAMDWQTVTMLSAGEAAFRAEWHVPAGGWYRLEARALRQGAVVGEAVVEHVGVGEVFLVAGQSNAANHGEERQTTRTGRVAALHDGKWRLANDPQPGASGDGGSFLPAFGDALVERLGVPVGLIPAAVGATSVREWLPRGARFPNPPTLTGGAACVSLPPAAREARDAAALGLLRSHAAAVPGRG